MNEFIKMFTNWSWSLQVVFYYLFGFGFSFSEMVLKFCIVYLMIPVWGTIWIVYGLVLIIILNNGNFILELVGQYSSGVVFFGNALFHYIPPLILIHFFLNYMSACKIIMSNSSFYIENPRFFWIYQIYSPFLIMLIYFSIFDYREVYGVSINPFYLGAIAFFIVTFSSGNLLHLLLKKKNKDILKIFLYQLE